MLQCYLLTFLTSVLTYDDHTYDQEDLLAFWNALDVPQELCHMLAGRGVMWYGGKLHVLSAYKSDIGAHPTQSQRNGDRRDQMCDRQM